MIIELQLFGGRGSSSKTTDQNGSKSKFPKWMDGSGGDVRYITDMFKGKQRTLTGFEDAIRDAPVEIKGIFDEKGQLVVAVTSNSNSSVKVVPEQVNAYTVTHNHPIEGDRKIGATLSGADIRNAIRNNNYQIRAVANGPNENVYILRMTKEHAKLRQAELKANREFEDEFKKGHKLIAEKASLKSIMKQQDRTSKADKKWRKIKEVYNKAKKNNETILRAASEEGENLFRYGNKSGRLVKHQRGSLGKAYKIQRNFEIKYKKEMPTSTFNQVELGLLQNQWKQVTTKTDTYTPNYEYIQVRKGPWSKLKNR